MKRQNCLWPSFAKSCPKFSCHNSIKLDVARRGGWEGGGGKRERGGGRGQKREDERPIANPIECKGKNASTLSSILWVCSIYVCDITESQLNSRTALRNLTLNLTTVFYV